MAPARSDFGKGIFTLWNAIFGVFDLSSMLHAGEWRQLAIIFFSAFLFLSNVRVALKLRGAHVPVMRGGGACSLPLRLSSCGCVFGSLLRTPSSYSFWAHARNILTDSACAHMLTLTPTTPCARVFRIVSGRLQIVLLNMLIALMRDIYQKVRDSEQDVFLRGRAQLIVEVETLMSAAQVRGWCACLIVSGPAGCVPGAFVCSCAHVLEARLPAGCLSLRV